jgi:SAM-dependent methyltransferase
MKLEPHKSAVVVCRVLAIEKKEVYMPLFDLAKTLGELASRNAGQTEADIQAGIRDVLLFGGFDLGDEAVRLESPAEDRRRLDVAVGSLIIECKKDLRTPAALDRAQKQLGLYLGAKASHGGRYTGVLTDGAIWRLYRHTPSGPAFIDQHLVSPTGADERSFRWWLGAVLSTEHAVIPSSVAIEERLGSRSPSYRLAHAALLECWDAVRTHPTAALKRQLWARLLHSALGSQFEDTDEMFIDHTYLVLLATLIGHAVVEFDLAMSASDPGVLLSGQLFERAGLLGVGQAGFFDWPLDAPSGAEVVADLARRLGSFTWKDVDHDVLKILYQSVIAPEVRHRLGEYYTPDWLAEKMITEVIDDPLSQRVLDPACGSGTFLFHAVRRYLDAADEAGHSANESLEAVMTQVFGMDLHPVAVTLAQTTFLLAIGTNRLAQRTGTLSVPVYLGDSMIWDASDDMLRSDAGDVVIYTTDGAELFATELRFPAGVVADVGRFDQLVSEMAKRASDRAPGTVPQSITGVLKNLHVSNADRPTVEMTYKVLCDLFDQGRDHIWGFYIRNQARPSWLTRSENRVDVVVGNPPWLSYRYMSATMQEVFQRRAKERKLWKGGGRGRTTQQDLSAFFVARSVELYLKVGGSFAFVMPRAVLSRQTYEGFRVGDWSAMSESCRAAFRPAWDLKDVDPEPFPVPAAVVFGHRGTEYSALPASVVALAGVAPSATRLGSISSSLATVHAVTGEEPASVYKERFRQGAILVPRMLIMINDAPTSPLGVPQGRRAVVSRKTSLDKKPWKDLPPMEGVVESILLRPAVLGESIAPFRTLRIPEAVIPYDGTRLLSGDDERIDRYPGLASWLREAEAVWLAKRSSEKRTLLEQFDYMHQLSAQFPLPPIRVVYTASGNAIAAAVLQDASAVIEHNLYWAPARTLDEARYLTAALNTPALTEFVRPYQSLGAFGPRHFDKYIWQMPIPEFDSDVVAHRTLVDLAIEAERVAAEVTIPAETGFQAARKLIRTALTVAGLGERLDEAVGTLLTMAATP